MAHGAPVPVYSGSQTEFSKVWIRGNTATSTLPKVKLYTRDGRALTPVGADINVTIVHTAADTLYNRIRAGAVAAGMASNDAFDAWWSQYEIVGMACEAITGDSLLVQRAEKVGSDVASASNFYARETFAVGRTFTHGPVPPDTSSAAVEVTVNGRIRAAITPEMQVAVSQTLNDAATTLTLQNAGFTTLLYEPSAVTGACTTVVEILSPDNSTWTAIPTFEASTSSPTLTNGARSASVGVLRAANIYGAAQVRIRRASLDGTGCVMSARLSGVEIRPYESLSSGVVQNQVYGAIAQDSAIGSGGTASPVLMGLEARTSDGTAVGNGDAVRGVASTLGKQVGLIGAVPGLSWQYAGPSGGITDTADDVIVAAAGAGVRNYLSSLQIYNASTTATEVVIKDGSTVIWRMEFDADGGAAGISINFANPLRSSTNTALNVACITTGTKVYVNAQGYTAGE
jgi:hypothetical protein